MQKVCAYLDKKSTPSKQMDGHIKQVAQCSHMMSDTTVLDTTSPDSCSVCVETIKKQQKDVMKQMHDVEDKDNLD